MFPYVSLLIFSYSFIRNYTYFPSPLVYSKNLTQKYLSVLRKVAHEGVGFQRQVVLITGCGKGSIGLEMVKGLLRGGAKVYATTSRWSPEAFQLYQRIYDEHGAKQRYDNEKHKGS